MSERHIYAAPDNWLASMMGCSAYRAVLSDNPTSAQVPLQSLPSEEPAFLYARIDTADVAGAHRLEDAAFHLIDTNVQLERQKRPAVAYDARIVRFAEAADRDGVKQLAASCFTQSRFHLDPGIGTATANRLKAEWAGNFFTKQRGDAMVVAHRDSAIVGFLQLLHPSTGEWVIDLIGVASTAQGQGIGSQMIAFAETQCDDCDHLTVGTQVANTQSLRFYERNGFRISATSYVFHSHRRPAPKS